jgi:two-component sensor histidine kinase
MASNLATTSPSPRQPAQSDDLLLRETNHRCSNDLQLVVSLLALQSRRVTSPEAREALTDATSRVGVLARSRAELSQQRQASLQTALRQVCEALHSLAETRSILISLQAEQDVQGLTSNHVATLALVVNELATNAIKHAFEEGKAGHISISVRQNGRREAVIIVDDDGLPFPDPTGSKDGGMGLGLVKRLVASVDGLLIPPSSGTKRFEIRVPVQSG